MTGFAATAFSPVRLRRVGFIGAAAAAAAAFSLLLTLAIARKELPLSFVLAGGIGLLVVATIAMARYESAVWLGMILLAVVKVEPAPTDAVFLVAIAVGLVTGRLTLRRVPGAVGVLLAAFLALNLTAMTQSISVGRTIRFSFITFYLALLAVWLGGWVSSTARARVVVRGYTGAAVLSAMLGVGAVVGVVPGRSSLTYGDGTRALALFKDPNVFGAFLVPAALILLDEALARKLLRTRRIVLIGGFLLTTLGIVLSFSRAAWASEALGIAVMVVVFSLRRGGGGRAALVLAITVASTAVAFIVLSASGSITFLHQRSHLQGYDSARFGAQERGLALVQHHPLGVGPGQFELYVPLSAHETYVRALAEIGFLGLAAIASLLLVTLLLALRNVVLARETYGIGSAPLLGAWSGLMFSGFFIDTLHWRHLWIVAALVWAGALRPRRTRPI